MRRRALTQASENCRLESRRTLACSAKAFPVPDNLLTSNRFYFSTVEDESKSLTGSGRGRSRVPRIASGSASPRVWTTPPESFARHRLGFSRRYVSGTQRPCAERSWLGDSRRGWSRSACRTHLRNVSLVQPIFSAIDSIAARCESCADWCSSTMRTARSRTSGEYLFEKLIALSSQVINSPVNPVQFTTRWAGARRNPGAGSAASATSPRSSRESSSTTALSSSRTAEPPHEQPAVHQICL